MMPTVELKPSSSARLPIVKRILRICNSAADHRIDIHVKVGMLGQELQLLVENLQAFLRNIVWRHVVDGDLQPFQPARFSR